MGFATTWGMMETIQWNQPAPLPEKNQKPVFRMTSNDRTAGSMPIWESAKTSTQRVEQALSSAQHSYSIEPYGTAYQSLNTEQATEEFSFGDLVDMVNPLHHIPLVNVAYREITGDSIKPIGNIVGGAIFGGVAGAAVGIMNVVVQEETGKDMGENAIAMIMNGERPTLKVHTNSKSSKISSREDIIEWNNPNEGISQDLSLALLSFSDLKQDLPMPKKPQAVYND